MSSETSISAQCLALANLNQLLLIDKKIAGWHPHNLLIRKKRLENRLAVKENALNTPRDIKENGLFGSHKHSIRNID